MKIRMVKRIVGTLLALVMPLSMVACGEEEAAETTESVVETAEDSAESSAPESVEGALKGVTLSFGTSGLFAPFSYYDEDGNLIGFDIDFCNALQDYLGFEIDGEMQAMDYSALGTSLAEGKLDFGMAALCATDERKEVMSFTNTYCDSGLSIGINTETSPSELNSVDMLSSGDYKLAVEKGTASHMYAQKIGVPESSLEVHDEITTAYESLEQGKVDAVMQDTPGLAYYIKTADDTKVKIVGEPFNQGQSPYAIAFSFDCVDKNPEIVEIFNKAVEDLIADGTYDELSKKWLE
ncbi:polar amino acid transport system substrate-binding protein [Pseudobutyrivibrio sp. YE44]|uniref:substrate-binding periplasmic protein n=1 Tax=Pseudobutyrivibrio sp. YE44 TaxID=1520802 RepID=UPI0008851F92|nr:transporter substrate-binding domain-containing protein [Pseudobutyrivibrio sp. YE44]SDB48011.1 polar amino acid transport system substrate-binding protein [Pseudobutyrivibrio sp. YE44]